MINLHEVWDWAGIDLVTPGPAVRRASVVRKVTDCATRHGMEGRFQCGPKIINECFISNMATVHRNFRYFYVEVALDNTISVQLKKFKVK